MSTIRAIRSSGGIGPTGASGAGSNPVQIIFSGALGTVGVSYTGALTASGGTAPYTYSISAGSLPGGLSLNTSTGAITGTPTTSGTYTFSGMAVDSLGHSATTSCSIQIGGGVLTISYSGTIASVNFPFNAALVASGGVEPYTYSILSGSLPSGLSLNTSTGQISGTPTVGGSFPFVGKVVDANSNNATVSATVIVQYFDVPGASVSAVTGSEVSNSVYQDSLEGLHLVLQVNPTVSSPSGIFPVRVRVWFDFDDGNSWQIFGDWYADTSTPTFTFGQQTQQNGVVVAGDIWVPSNPANVNWQVAVEANSHDALPSGAAATGSFMVTPAQAPTSTDVTSAQFIPNPYTNDILIYDVDHLGGYDWLYNEINWFQPTITQNPYYWFSSITVQLGYEATGTGTVTGGNSISSLAGITLTNADVGMDVHIGGSGGGVGATLSTIATVNTGANTFTTSSTVPNGAGQIIAIWRQAPVNTINGIQGTDDDTGSPPLYKGRQFTDSGTAQGNPGGVSQPGSWVILIGTHPADWTLPPALLQDGVTANPYVTFRFRIYSWSRLGTNSTGGSGTSALQVCWQTSSGPNTSDHFDANPTQQQAALDLSQTNPDKSFTVTSPISGGNGTPLDISVTGPVTVTSKQITISPLGITNAYIGAQAVQALNMATNAVTYANAAIAANAIVDSNVASTQIGKLIAGTVVFSGSIALAAGNGQAVVTMDNTGIYLFSDCTASGSGVTPGTPGNPTYSASGITSSPYVGVTASQIGVFGSLSGGLQPSVTITGTGINLWSNNGDTGHPYATFTSTAFVYNNSSFQMTQSASQIQFKYTSGPTTYSTTINSTSIVLASPGNTCTFSSTSVQLVSGSYSTTISSTGMLFVGASGSVQITSIGVQLINGSYSTTVTSTGIKLLFGSTYSLVMASSSITLYSVDGNTSSPYMTLTSGAGIQVVSGTFTGQLYQGLTFTDSSVNRDVEVAPGGTWFRAHDGGTGAHSGLNPSQLSLNDGAGNAVSFTTGSGVTFTDSTNMTTAGPNSQSTPGRSAGTIYHNANNRALYVAVSSYLSITGTIYGATGSSSPPGTVVAQSQAGGSDLGTLFFVVPSGYFYTVSASSGTLTIATWTEWN